MEQSSSRRILSEVKTCKTTLLCFSSILDSAKLKDPAELVAKLNCGSRVIPYSLGITSNNWLCTSATRCLTLAGGLAQKTKQFLSSLYPVFSS